MYSLDLNSTAVSEITGEHLEGARLRLGALERFDVLVPAAEAGQALLESALLSGLGEAHGQKRPFGLREAKPVAGGLVLRVERAEDVQALVTLLPYCTKKGAWRGVRGLSAAVDGARLRFGVRPWVLEHPWRGAVPAVWVVGPHGEDLAALLAAHREQLRASGRGAQWDPQVPEPGPKRREPVERSLMRRLGASYAMGSALLRRPRLWDGLAGHAGVCVGTVMTECGLDWVVERLVSGEEFDCARLTEVLTDVVVGCGLRVLDHACTSVECVVRLAPRPGMWGWRGVLTVHSRRALPGTETPVPAPRPFSAIGGRRDVSRPAHPGSDGGARQRGNAVVELSGVPGASGVDRDMLTWVAEQLAAVWAAQGLAAAVVLPRQDSRTWFRDPGQPSWATAPVPDTEVGWRRLRIVPPPGELWSVHAAADSESVSAVLAHAGRTFDRIVVVGAGGGWHGHVQRRDLGEAVRVLVHGATAYQRHIPLPATNGEQVQAVALTPAESAAQWRQEELGRWTPPHPVTGMLLLTRPGQAAPGDAFDLAVEDQLARYGTPVLGGFPSSGFIIRGRGHSPHPPTVLDPQLEGLAHAEMVAAADALAQRLWPTPSGRTPRDAHSAASG